jgi:hypothetical protein
MQSGDNSKVIELQGLLRQINTERHTLEHVNSRIASLNASNIEKLLMKKRQIEQNIMKLTAKKDELNDELVDKEQLFETIKMRYAILLLQNYGNPETEHLKAGQSNYL